MPYPNQHAARVRQPGNFVEGSFRTKRIANGINAIMGRLSYNTNTMVVQAYRFDKSVYTPEEARNWLKEHKISYISFEPASG